MKENRLSDYLDHMHQAAVDACGFVTGMTKDEFVVDKRTQQAVIMNMIIIGEAATKVMDRYGEFVKMQSDVPWRNMRGMRNRIAHGYFAINLDLVCETVKKALPDLLTQLPDVQQAAVRVDSDSPDTGP